MLSSRFISFSETVKELEGKKILHLKSPINNLFVFRNFGHEEDYDKYFIIWYGLGPIVDGKFDTITEVRVGDEENLKKLIKEMNEGTPRNALDIFEVIYTKRENIPIVDMFLNVIELSAGVLMEFKVSDSPEVH